MKLTLRIRKKETGEVRDYVSEWPVDFPIDYFFGDGNGGCDCQRADWFATAGNEPDPNINCTEDKFALTVIGEDGEHLYSDDDIETEAKADRDLDYRVERGDFDHIFSSSLEWIDEQ